MIERDYLMEKRMLCHKVILLRIEFQFNFFKDDEERSFDGEDSYNSD